MSGSRSDRRRPIEKRRDRAREDDFDFCSKSLWIKWNVWPPACFKFTSLVLAVRPNNHEESTQSEPATLHDLFNKKFRSWTF